jgi:GT2 family glycosyltransferase
MQSSTSPYPAVGIGILNWNGKKWLEQFLPYLYEISYKNYRIYVIDNDSSDDSISYLQSHHPNINIISTGGNHGFAGGYNRSFAQMPEPYLLMLNSDVEVTEGFLEPMVEMMENDATIAVVQSKLLSFHQRDHFEYGGAAGGMMDVLGYTFCRGRIFDELEADKGQYDSGRIFWACGACCLVRKDAYQKVRGMYEYFFMHFEEIDLCWRLQANGYSINYSKESVVYHVGGATLSYQSHAKTYLNFRNNLVMVVKNSGLPYLLWWLPVRWLLDMLAMLKFLLAGDGKHAWAVIKAYAGLLAWAFTSVDKKHTAKLSLSHMDIVSKKSIVWQFFVKKRKAWSAIQS